MKEANGIISALSLRYPQLRLPIADGMSGSERYKAAVLRGIIPDADPEGFGSALDSFREVRTALGTVGVWRLEDRADFVRAVQALVYRCEPTAIPAAVGAQYIGGLANWEKIRAHKTRYLAGGGRDWGQEFRRFTADKANYTDSLILLSSGFYSDIPPEALSMSAEEWKSRSMTVRGYHELTHFLYRRAYPGDVDVIRDEVLADCMGLMAAFGHYSPALAERFLGIRASELLPEARLRHYVPADALAEGIRLARFWINTFAALLADFSDQWKFFDCPVTDRGLPCIYR